MDRAISSKADSSRYRRLHHPTRPRFILSRVPAQTGDHPELFQLFSRIILLSSIPIMLRFILLILYIIDTMFIKYLIFILMRT